MSNPYGRAIVVFLAVIMIPSSSALANRYGWSISNSPVTPTSNSGSPAGGVVTLYLWFICDSDTGISASEFDLTVAPLVAPTAVNGWANLGTEPSHWLATIGQCPHGPMVAATLLYMDMTGISVCIQPSAENGRLVGVDCEQNPDGLDFLGYDSTGDGPCKLNDAWQMCNVGVQSTGWGTVKALYR